MGSNNRQFVSRHPERQHLAAVPAPAAKARQRGQRPRRPSGRSGKESVSRLVRLAFPLVIGVSTTVWACGEDGVDSPGGAAGADSSDPVGSDGGRGSGGEGASTASGGTTDGSGGMTSGSGGAGGMPGGSGGMTSGSGGTTGGSGGMASGSGGTTGGSGGATGGSAGAGGTTGGMAGAGGMTGGTGGMTGGTGGSTSSPCAVGDPEFDFESAPAMVTCVGTAQTQCGAEANCGPGYHMCTASEYAARGSVGKAGQRAWLASCIIEDGVPQPESDEVCSSCENVTGISTVAWTCDGLLPGLTQIGEDYTGLTTSVRSYRIFDETSGTCAQWVGYSSSNTLTRTVCCE